MVHCSDIIYTIYNSNENILKQKPWRSNITIMHQWISISFKTWWTHHSVLLKATITLNNNWLFWWILNIIIAKFI